jgi:hypothetical protein
VADSYFDPVSPVWTRVAGVVLLAAAAGLTAALGYALFEYVVHDESRRTLTSSSLIFGLILLALCGICWQAGYRLAFNRPDRNGSLFSRPAWFAIGGGLIVVTAAMAYAIVTARPPTGLDYWVIVTFGALGVWCIILAFRTGRRQAP